MPNTREKLIELLRECFDNGCYGFDEIADHLIANGVTIQECKVVEIDHVTDTNVGKWISVKDRLPDKQEYDWVLVQLKLVPEEAYGVPCVAELRNGDWYDAEGCWIGTDPEGGCVIVTHWMPLPEPPKGEQQ